MRRGKAYIGVTELWDVASLWFSASIIFAALL
jgi:hypothetical protein